MALTSAQSTAAQLVLAYLGRGTDVATLQSYAANFTNGMPTASQLSTLFATAESQGVFGAAPSLSSVIYKSFELIGRTPTTQQATDWVNWATTQKFSLAQLPWEILKAGLATESTYAANQQVLWARTALAYKYAEDISANPTAVQALASSATAQANARALIAAATDVTTAQAIYNGTGTVTIAGSISNIANQSGQTFTLTTGVDNITGTSGNDTVTGLWGNEISGGALVSAANLSTLDAINGGDGQDILNINIQDGTSKLTAVNTSNIETVNVKSTGAATVDTTAGFNGVTALNVTQTAGNTAVTAATTTDVSVAGVTGGTITVDGGKKVVVTDATAAKDIIIGDATVNAGTITVTDTKVGAAHVKVDGGTDVTLTLTGSDATGGKVITVGNGGAATDLPSGVVNVSSAHTATAATDVTLNAITVKGGTTVTVTQTADTSKAAADTTGATLTQGAVTVVGGNTTTSVTVSQAKSTAEVVAVTAVAGATETASVKFSALTAGQTLILGGLTFTATADMTKEQAAAAFANLINGTLPTAGDSQSAGAASKGAYTGAFTGWTSGAASGDTVVFTSTTADTNVGDLANTGTGTATVTTTAGSAATAAKTGVLGVKNGQVTIDDNATVSITTVSVDGYANGSTIGNTTSLTKLASLSLANSGDSGTAGQTNASMTVDAAGVASLALTLNNIKGAVSLDGAADNALKTLSVTTTGADSSFNLTAAAVETLTVAGDKKLTLGADLAAVKSVTVNGSASLILSGNESDTLTSVNSSGTTGAVTATIDGTKATYTGGAGVDTVTLATGTSLTKAIDLGAGDDTLSFAALNVTGSSAAVAGGDGTDTLSMAAATAAALDGSKQSFYTGFERLTVNDAGAGETLDLANLGFTNYVTTNGGTITLDKLANNGTVVLNAATTATTVQITDAADATKGTADVLNVTTNVVSADVIFGTLTAANVETININADDTKLDDNADGKNDPVETATLKLVATKATSITVTGDSNLTLDNAGNTAVTSIDASTLTGNLTVQAAGTVASTIKGGSGADVLTASGGTTGGTAQVSTITLTDGTANTGLDDNDTMSVIVNGTKFTYTADQVVTMDVAGAALAALIDADAAYTSSYNAGTDTITVTAAVAGTPFTLSSYAVTDVANDVNKTATAAVITETVATVQQKDTVAVTADLTDDGNEVATVTYDSDGSSGVATASFDVSLVAIVPTTKAAVTNALVTAMNLDAGFSALAVASNVSDDLVVTYKGNDTYTKVAVTVKADTSANLAFGAAAATATAAKEQTTVVYTGTATGTPNLGKGDTMAVTIDYDGAGAGAAETITYTVTADAGETLDAAATGLQLLIHAKAGVDATINTGTDTITITDAVSSDANGITVTAFTVTDVAETTNTTGTAGAFATTTANVTSIGDTLIGNAGNDTLKSGAALGTMTGGDGQDLFVVNVASTNVNAYTTITDFTANDLLQFNATTSGFKNAAVTLGGTAVFQDYANAAMNALAADEAGWFQFGGDTYIVLDVGANSTTFVNGTDMIVKLTGSVDLSNASFNNTYDTIAL